MVDLIGVATWKLALDALKIRVAVRTPFDRDSGPIITELNRYGVIECKDLPAVQPAESIILKQLGSESQIFLHFLREQDISDDLTDFNEFQPYRAVYAILEIVLEGETIVDGKVSTTSTLTYPIQKQLILRSMDQFTSSIPLLVKELATEILCHFDRLLGELAVQQIILSPRQKDQHLIGPTTTPTNAPTINNTQAQSRLRSRTAGRLATLMGQFFLMAGAYGEAVTVLGTAIEDTKANGDLLWYAGAQEALQISLALHGEANLVTLGAGPTSKSDSAGRDGASTILGLSLPEKLREVAPLYVKADAAVLAFEVHRIMAAILDALGGPAEAAMALGHGWTVNRHLPFMDKLYVVSVIIQRFEELKMPRKRAFFLQILSNLLAKQQEMGMATTILQQTFPVYNVGLDSVVRHGWMACAMATLKRAIDLAEAQKLNHALIVQLHCALLAYLYESNEMSESSLLEEERRIFKALASRSRTLSAPISVNFGQSSPVCILPLLDMASIDQDGLDLWQRPKASPIISTSSTSGDGLFLYNPLTGRNRSQQNLDNISNKVNKNVDKEVAMGLNDVINVKLQLRNPFKHKLILQECIIYGTIKSEESESLITVTSEPAQIILVPGHAKSFNIPLRATRPGIIELKQLQFLLFEAPFHLNLKGDSLSIPVLGIQPQLRATNPDEFSILSIFEGEEKYIEINVINNSKVVASRVSMSLTMKWSQDPLTVEEIVLQSQTETAWITERLPDKIKGEIQATGKIAIMGHKRLRGIEVEISYSGCDASVASTFCRSLHMPIQCTIHHSISIRNIIGVLGQTAAFTKLKANIIHNEDDGGEEKVFAGDDVEEDCILVLDLVNHLGEKVVLDLPNEESLIISRASEKRAILPMSRIVLLNEQPLEVTPNQLNRLRRECGWKEVDIDKLDRQVLHLRNCLDKRLTLKWRLGERIKGKVDLHQAQLFNIPALILPPLRLRFEYENLPHYPTGKPILFKAHVVGQLPPGVRQYMLQLTPAIYLAEEYLDYEHVDDYFTYHGALVGWDSRVPWFLSVQLWGILPHRLCLRATLQYDDAQGMTIMYRYPYPLYFDFLDDSNDINLPSQFDQSQTISNGENNIS